MAIFFFQAEDGIRDVAVTGVQTCALPIFFRLEAENADLVGLGGADLADPDDTETGFAPTAADFDGLAGAGQEADAVQTRAFLAEIDGIGALDKRMAVGGRTFDD